MSTMDMKNAFGKFLRFIFTLIWKLCVLCLWACLRAIEFVSRTLADWIKQLLTPKDRRNNNDRKDP